MLPKVKFTSVSTSHKKKLKPAVMHVAKQSNDPFVLILQFDQLRDTLLNMSIKLDQ